MLNLALRLDMALYSTSLAYVLAPPIVTLPVIAIFTFRLSSSAFLHYKSSGIWSKTTGPAEAGFP